MSIYFPSRIYIDSKLAFKQKGTGFFSKMIFSILLRLVVGLEIRHIKTFQMGLGMVAYACHPRYEGPAMREAVVKAETHAS
jgi:hypothetical protein